MSLIISKNTIKYLTKQKHEIYNKYVQICNELDLEINNLKNMCSHSNKEKRREDCLYGSTYYYCPDCELDL